MLQIFYLRAGLTIKKFRKKSTRASRADKHKLYEASVQCAESEVDFVEGTFRELRNRSAHLFREDFCGTANVCCEWVGRHRKNEAIGVDLDSSVLEWGRKNRIKKLGKNVRLRIQLLEQNVLTCETPKQEIISAMNFSYWLFKTREQLREYFRKVHRDLKSDGIFFLDAYGGYDAFRELEEEREVEDFTYIWEQAHYNPINGDMTCHIHFEFDDGSRMDRAFEYHWRLWTLPEIKELLAEAGFSSVTVYWQGWDEDGEADGEFYPATEADADAGWICYIVAEK